jgi:hypothetical protein
MSEKNLRYSKLFTALQLTVDAEHGNLIVQLPQIGQAAIELRHVLRVVLFMPERDLYLPPNAPKIRTDNFKKVYELDQLNARTASFDMTLSYLKADLSEQLKDMGLELIEKDPLT